MENIENPKFGDSTLALGFKVYFSIWIGGVLWEAGHVASSVDGGNRRRQGVIKSNVELDRYCS